MLLSACRDSGYYGFLRLPNEVLTPVLALALAHGIEPDYVRNLIRRRKLPPPGPDAPGWPWPLALRTFGDFEIARDGVPLVSKGKAQKKPLELLKALVAHGGRGVDAAMLTALLWPDAEGDDAKTSFDSNLYRLRKLVDVDGAVQLAEGKLSLNPELVCVDTWAFDAALEAGDVDAALALYRGHFLALDAPVPWALAGPRPAAGEAHPRRPGGRATRYERERRVGPRAVPLRARARGRQPGRGDLPAPHDLPARNGRSGGRAARRTGAAGSCCRSCSPGRRRPRPKPSARRCKSAVSLLSDAGRPGRAAARASVRLPIRGARRQAKSFACQILTQAPRARVRRRARGVAATLRDPSAIRQRRGRQDALRSRDPDRYRRNIMQPLRLILAAARIVAGVALVVLVLKVAPTIASQAVGHAGTYSPAAVAIGAVRTQ